MIYKLIFFFFGILMIGCKGPTDSKIQTSSPYGKNDDWGFVGYGGGGAMFNPNVNPHDPDFVFVSCDMTGSYVTYNGGQSWRMFCLHSPIDFYVFDLLDANTVYANSIGLFKSTDRGNTWQIVYPDPSEIIEVISQGDHAAEVLVTRDSTRREVLTLSIDPSNSRKLFAAISMNGVVALYFSDNAGTEWNKEKELEDVAKNIFIVPSSPENNRTLYITGKNSITTCVNGIWKTNKGPKDLANLTVFTGGFDQKQDKFIIYAISGMSYFNHSGDTS